MYVLSHRPTGTRWSAALLGLALALTLGGCITTRLVDHWKDPAFTGPPLRKVLVVGVQADAGRRRLWEDAMVGALRTQHVQAIPSYLSFPDKAPSGDELSTIASREGFDGVLATHFINARQRAYWMAGGWGWGWGWGWRYGYWGGWGGWGGPWGPGYVGSEYQADYQTDLFTTVPNGGKLIWTGITRSVDLYTIGSTTHQISHVLVPDLVHDGVLSPS